MNVWNTCLAILRERGYELSLEADDPEADLTECIWVAKEGEYDLWASNPIQLLGLASIHRYHNPAKPPASYWWMIENVDIMDELIEKRWPDDDL